MVKYCCRTCQIAHRQRHKNACKKRAAELFDEELFKDPPEREECPICMLPLPLDQNLFKLHACCGNVLCSGCIHAQYKEDIRSGKMTRTTGASLCPFCRAPKAKSQQHAIALTKKLVEKNHSYATLHWAEFHAQGGGGGFVRDMPKAIDLYLKAGEFGCTEAYNRLGRVYCDGNGVEKDLKKARHFLERAVIGGNIHARDQLGVLDAQSGDSKRACKHFMICAKAGFELSLKRVKQGFKEGFITKDEYAEALRAYQKQEEDAKSNIRDEAVAYMINPSLYWTNS